MIRKQPQHKQLAAAVLAALVSMSTLPVLAQEASTQPAQEEAKTLDQIVVTAQKREEAMQDVPVSLTALPKQLLQDTGVRDIKDMQTLVPGLTVTSTQSEASTTARIRGIGTVGDNAGLESSVGVVIDGVYRPRNSVGFGDLGELERIEVLKGPQGTLFGKNTSAGVINVITKKPSFDQRVSGEITVGNYGALGVSAEYNDALGENAAFSIYAAQRKRDGFIDVHTGAGPRTEDEDFDQNFHTLRGKLLLEPADSVDILLSADYTSREENCCTAVTMVRGPTGALIDALAADTGVAPVADPFAREAWSNRSTEQDMKDKGVSAQVDWRTSWLGNATLTSITAWRDWKTINGQDFDFSTADLLYRNADGTDNSTGFKTFSQEVRLAGATDSIDWLVGLFYANEDLARNEGYRVGAAYEPYLSIALGGNPLFFSNVTGLPYGTVFAGYAAADHYEQNSRSLALFTNNTWHATDALDLTLGLRYTREKKELDSIYTNPNGGAGCAALLANAANLPAAVVGYGCLPWTNVLHDGRVTHQERDEKEWSGTFKAAYRFNEHVMSYFSAARGYKAGGFNLDRVQSSNGLSSGGPGIIPVDDTSFPGEFVDSYELGAKTTWAGGNLLLNAALFHQTYDDFQLNSFVGTSFVVRSIPKVVSKGLDTEILYQRGGLSLQGGIVYADTKYGDDLVAGFPLLPGARISFAPKWSGTASVTYTWDIGSNLEARFNLGAKYMSEYNTGSDLLPQKVQEAYTIANARVGIGSRDRRWQVELWGLNITDAEYRQVVFNAPLQTGSYNAFLGAPATYGVTFRFNYR